MERREKERQRKRGLKERIEKERDGEPKSFSLSLSFSFFLSLPLSPKEWKHNTEGPGRPVPRIRVIDSVMSRTTRARS